MHMRIIAGIVLVLALVAGGWAYFNKPVEPASRFALLSDEQRKAYDALSDNDIRSLQVNSTDGPVIQVNAPSGYSLASPVDFDIRVEPRGGVPVDMGSIRIEYRLGPAWINMTRTLLKYAEINGSRLSARGAELPKGKHALRVSIEDVERRKTQATVSFTVTR